MPPRTVFTEMRGAQRAQAKHQREEQVGEECVEVKRSKLEADEAELVDAKDEIKELRKFHGDTQHRAAQVKRLIAVEWDESSRDAVWSNKNGRSRAEAAVDKLLRQVCFGRRDAEAVDKVSAANRHEVLRSLTKRYYGKDAELDEPTNKYRAELASELLPPEQHKIALFQETLERQVKSGLATTKLCRNGCERCAHHIAHQAFAQLEYMAPERD